MAGAKLSQARRALGFLVSVLAIAAAVAFGMRYVERADRNPLSQDVVITADAVNVSAAVPGRIIAFGVSENGVVKKGDLLFRLDPKPYELQVAQVTADLAIAEAALADQARTVSAEQSNAGIAREQVARAESNLALATQTLARLQALRPKGYVSAQQVDDAATLKRDAEVSLSQALKQQDAADALVSNTAAATALVAARKAALAIAERALADTEVFAPVDGKVVGLTTAVGANVLPGQAIFTLIDNAAWFASANFLETELSEITIGSCATVFTLADRTRVIHGRVEGIGWGVLSTDAIALPFNMPLVPKSLNWVRVAQRFPVRIRLFDPPDDLMRVGASATATVHHGRSC